MTQEEVNTIYNLTIIIHENDWFGKRKKKNKKIGKKYKNG